MQPVSNRPANAFALFVERAGEGRNSLPRILLGTLIIVVVWFAGTFLLLGLGAFVLAMGWLPESWVVSDFEPFTDFAASRPGLAAMVLTLGFIWPGVWLAMRLVHKRRLRTLFGAGDRIVWSDFRRAAVATAIVAVLVSLVTLATEPLVERTDLSLFAWILALLPLAAFLLIQTSAEEILFRGYLMQNLAQRFRSPLVWAVLPAAIFAAAHWYTGAQPWMNAMVMYSIFLFAMAAVVLVWLTGNLGAAMGMHFANNMVALLFMSSGRPAQSLAIYVTPPIEYPYWTFADALLSGLTQTVLSGGILLLLLWRRSPLRLASAARAVSPSA